MKRHLVSAVLLGFALGTACAQDPTPPQMAGPGTGWQGQPDGPGMRMAGGNNTMGTVTAVAADHYVIKTDAGDVYTVHFSANTRILKQRIRRGAPGQASQGGDAQPSGPQMLKPSEIQVGDVIGANGEIDTAAKSVGAVFIVKIDPERVQQMRAMEASYGKTWLMGRVTAIDGVKVTLHGGPDNASHSFVADENTTFRKRREPITLADVQVGDMVRVEGVVRDGAFTAATVGVMVPPRPRGTPMMPQGITPQ